MVANNPFYKVNLNIAIHLKFKAAPISVNHYSTALGIVLKIR